MPDAAISCSLLMLMQEPFDCTQDWLQLLRIRCPGELALTLEREKDHFPLRQARQSPDQEIASGSFDTRLRATLDALAKTVNPPIHSPSSPI